MRPIADRNLLLLRRAAVILLITAAGCVPAQQPPILNATSGPPVAVTSDRITTTAFSVAYPPGWRVILSPGDAPPFVTVAAPGDCTVIVIASQPIPSAPALPTSCEGAAEQVLDDAPLDGSTIYAAGVSTDPALLRHTLSRLMESLSPP